MLYKVKLLSILVGRGGRRWPDLFALFTVKFGAEFWVRFREYQRMLRHTEALKAVNSVLSC